MNNAFKQITARQWCCLWDAVQGSSVVPTSREEQLWDTTSDGAIAHPKSVIASLMRRGLLREVAAGIYVATQLSATALLLPVSDNDSLGRLAGSIATAALQTFGGG